MFAVYLLLALPCAILVNWLADRATAWMRDRERARVLGDPRLCRACGQPARGTAPELAVWGVIARRGRCPQCGARASLRPVLVELVLVAAFAYLWYHDIAPATAYKGVGDFARLALHSACLTFYCLITVTDLEYRLIIDAMMYPALAVAVVVAFVVPLPNAAWQSALAGGALAFVFFYLAALLGQMFFGAGALGGGDVTLAAFIGLTTGFPLVIVALVLGILAGGAGTLFLLVTRIRSLRSAVPYGPFLVVGGVAVLLWGPQIIAWYFKR